MSVVIASTQRSRDQDFDPVHGLPTAINDALAPVHADVSCSIRAMAALGCRHLDFRKSSIGESHQTRVGLPWFRNCVRGWPLIR